MLACEGRTNFKQYVIVWEVRVASGLKLHLHALDLFGFLQPRL